MLAVTVPTSTPLYVTKPLLMELQGCLNIYVSNILNYKRKLRLHRDRRRRVYPTNAVIVANVAAKSPATQIHTSATAKPITTKSPLNVLLAKTT